mmetsp:Transcript_7081/g.16022  ORF Transcript_7081/g.16022 Transcript_7081/m.16022 type:complete len:150 (-) Transcript_7081:444-893(-)
MPPSVEPVLPARGWIIALEVRKQEIPVVVGRQILSNMLGLLKRCELPSVSFVDVIMESTDPYVVKELQRASSCAESKGYDHLSGRRKEAVARPEKLVRFCHNKGLTWSQIQAPMDQRTSPWFALKPESQQAVLGLPHALDPDITSAELS